jgi:hypothetical protein
MNLINSVQTATTAGQNFGLGFIEEALKLDCS